MNILDSIFGQDTDDVLLPEIDEEVEIGLEARVILYNDEDHTFDEVINQIIRATGCSPATAEALTIEVHTKGKATVFEGEMSKCIRVSTVLEEISLHTQIEF